MKDLIEKLAQAEVPSRELDCLIGVAIGRFYAEPNRAWPELLDYVRRNADGSIIHPGYGGDQMVPRYTASIDEALTLVPEGQGRWPQIYYISPNPNNSAHGHRWEIWVENRAKPHRGHHGQSSAIALVIAALSAKEPSQ